MPVVSSSFALDGHVQADGGTYVRETHVLAVGGPIVIDYLAPAGTDYSAVMTARVATLNDWLAEQEAETQFDSVARVTLNEQTAAQFAARLREIYHFSNAGDTCRIAWWLLERIAAGDFTDQQCATAFGVTLTQWSNFKANKLQPQHDAWAAVRAAAGQ